MTRLAIIGAGLSGLVMAHRLADAHEVVVYEKSCGFGGRMATRYADEYEFDHGAQFFTARSGRFREFLKPIIEAGVIAPWQARFTELSNDGRSPLRTWDNDFPHYVGVPRMSAVGAFLAQGLDVRKETPLRAPQRQSSEWMLETADGTKVGAADWVISTAPAAQTMDLVPKESPVHGRARDAIMQGCNALMLGFSSPIEPGFDAALVRDADISWISVNSSKPGRRDAPTMVVHSTNAWAEANRGLSDQEIIDYMFSELDAVAPVGSSNVEHFGLQRWRYANLPKQSGSRFIIDADRSLAACGDWLIRGRVEAAFKSADSLATALTPLL